MSQTATFAADLLTLDADYEIDRIAAAVREQVLMRLRRKGVVIGLSGGIDSSVAAALCVEALGPKRVLGILMPEHDSASDSERLGRLLAEHYGIECILERLGPVLDAAGCYRRRDDAIRSVVPDFGPEDKSKIVLPGL